MKINPSVHAITYGPGSFKNSDGSVPTQDAVDAAFESFRLETERCNRSAGRDDFAQCFLQKASMPFDEPALAITVVVPESAASVERLLKFSDKFVTFVNATTSLKFDSSHCMVM